MVEPSLCNENSIDFTIIIIIIVDNDLISTLDRALCYILCICITVMMHSNPTEMYFMTTIHGRRK